MPRGTVKPIEERVAAIDEKINKKKKNSKHWRHKSKICCTQFL